MMVELRLYRAASGRLPDLLARFRNHTLKIWERHGIRQIGFWTTLVGESNHDLTYLLQWSDMAERDKKWNAFQTDPVWLETRAATEANGPLVANISNQFFTPTDFSALK